jgi:hypothetical protein
MRKYGQFHDGFFEGFWIDNTTVHVFLSTLEKEQFTAVAEGVVALDASGFRAGNIIFDVGVRDHEDIVFRDIAQLYDLREDPEGESQGMRLLDKARHEGMNLLEVCPTYGGACMVLAHSINLLKRSECLAGFLVSAKLPQ